MPTSASSQPQTGSTATRYQRLHALAPLGIDGTACLHLQKPWLSCRNCIDACPQTCLRQEENRLALDAGNCTGCGQCRAACPTAALELDGFAPQPPQTEAQEIVLACTRHTAAPATALRFPCLAGLLAEDIVGQLLRQPGIMIRLADEASCLECPNGRHLEHSAAEHLAATLLPILRSSHQPTDCVAVRQFTSRLPNGNAAQHPPTGSDTKAASRRAFFSGLARGIGNTVVRKANGHAALADLALLPRQPRSPIAHPRGERLHQLMLALAAASGLPPDRACLPALTVSSACHAHGICAHICPTGALQLETDKATRELRFDAWRCIGCGACAANCPEQAITHAPPQWRDFPAGTSLLARTVQTHCTRCGEDFVARREEDVCAACAKSAVLAHAGFSLFGNLRQPLPAETGPP